MAERRGTALDARGEALLGEVSADRLMEYDRTIAQWVRLSGSEEERKAFDYVESLARDWGLAVERYAPVCLTSWPGPATLTLLGNGEQPRCITHSFSTSTGPGGVEAEVVYLGAGLEADYTGRDVRGKFVLTEGLAGPPKVGPSERHGAAGVISISGPEIHEMIVSPVWGSPTPDTVDFLPTIPHVSIDRASGDLLKERLGQGTLRARVVTEVDTRWRLLPVLVATIAPPAPSDEFVMFSGHIDSWHYGAMDNGSANATQLEVARILAGHRDLLRREVRFAFWSGHSHARYGSSAWFADEFWQELHDGCVAHVNIDGPGAINATVLTEAPTMAETHGFARELIEYLSDQELEYRRIGRMGDQSFWGVGLPALFCTLSTQGAAESAGGLDTSAIVGGARRRGGSAWWWHTPDDTMDKIDPANLARDARILVATVYRLATDAVLPFDQTAAVDEVRSALSDIASRAGNAFDLSGVIAEADALREAASKLGARCQEPANEAQARALNRAIMAVSRELIPVNYTEHGQFEQDLALPGQPIPGLRPAVRLAGLPADSDERHLLEVKLRRERNRVRAALIASRRAVEAALAAAG